MTVSNLVRELGALRIEASLEVLEKAEEEFRERMSAYRGYEALAVAFTRFFLETVNTYNRVVVPAPTGPVSAQHGLFIEKLVRAFSTLCAARVTAHGGYPLQGFTLLRNIYDDCVLTSGALQGLTDFARLHGIRPGEDFEPKKTKRRRIEEEKTVRAKMDGDQSGLSDEVRRALALVGDMYDTETHGGRLATAYNVGFLKGAPLPVVPEFREDVAALFLNRWIETAWMAHRLSPVVQVPGAALPNAWAEKWRTIDDKFRYMVMSIANDLEKPYFKYLCDFVEAKFPFGPGSRFPL